jgi:hypothetical protein
MLEYYLIDMYHYVVNNSTVELLASPNTASSFSGIVSTRGGVKNDNCLLSRTVLIFYLSLHISSPINTFITWVSNLSMDHPSNILPFTCNSRFFILLHL